MTRKIYLETLKSVLGRSFSHYLSKIDDIDVDNILQLFAKYIWSLLGFTENLYLK